jgi:mannose-1-phosphate guanylyltransferase
MSPRANPSSRLHGVILAGGRGTRFWPRSRRAHPKQLMNLLDEESLLQQTVARLHPLIPPERVWVFTNEILVKQVQRHLPRVPAAQIIAEPARRNTAPSIGLAAELILARDPEAVMGVFPSDHVIGKPALFRRIIRLAASHALNGSIVVLGIEPRWPETGYGYMEFASRPNHRNRRAIPVKQFREKPDLRTAKRYVRSSRFFWNSGIFSWKASTLQQALRQHLPRTAEVLTEIAGQLSSARSAKARHRILNDFYPACENISVDYAVLEKSSGVVGIPCDVGWSDVGSWNAMFDLFPRDGKNNSLRSDSLLIDTKGVLVDVPGKIFAGVGLEDLVIIETGDALLVIRRDRAQDVSRVVEMLEERRRDDLL